ncbi:hypothetical protein GXW78_26835 [Roseomonas terrae]|uniref:F5/8 type C domain-containing protein n=1 Tax=Neoroseomonas terrae TaxID=424799 RepID=A0ABS5EQH5_9PROT|nr:hypothetical protein [Neoroseomonas terrae]MBR0653298.1 hypothetical protein [Neoroseomonas terrae]
MTWLTNSYRWGGAIPENAYWRVVPLATAYAGTPWPRIGEIIMAAGVGGAQLASGGTIIGAPTGFDISAGFARAFDGSAVTDVRGVAPLAAPSLWCGYQFPAPVKLGAIGIQAPASNQAETVAGIAIQYSADGIVWGTCEPSGPLRSLSASEVRWVPVKPVKANSRDKARIWRIANMSRGGGTVSIGQVYFRATPGGANLCVGGAHWGSNGTNQSVGPSEAFDGSLTQGFYGGANLSFLQYLWEEPPNPSYVALQRATGGNNGLEPTAFDVQWSCDGVNFTTALSVSGLSGWTSGQLREWAIP